MALRPVPIDTDSPFLEESCALCKETFQTGDEIVVCPDDATRHHVACWQANGSKCTAYGCKGTGVVGKVEVIPPASPRPRVVGGTPERSSRQPRSKVRVMPALNLSCRAGCMILLVLLTVIVGVSCGLAMWAVYDWIVTEGVVGFVPALYQPLLL